MYETNRARNCNLVCILICSPISSKTRATTNDQLTTANYHFNCVSTTVLRCYIAAHIAYGLVSFSAA